MKGKKQNTRLIKIRADKLAVHPTAQRRLIPANVARIFRDLDLDAIGTFHAVEYPIRGRKKIYIIDGQHRWEALMKHGFGEWEVSVEIHENVKDDAAASRLFLLLNKRSSIPPFDKYKNKLTERDATAVGITRIARKHGIEISRKTGDEKVSCISTLESAYEQDGGKTLDAVFQIIRAAWGAKAASLEKLIISGLCVMHKLFGGDMEPPTFINKLSKFPGGAGNLATAARNAKDAHRDLPDSRRAALVMMNDYNAGRRSRKLNLMKLYRQPKSRPANPRSSLPGKDECLADLRAYLKTGKPENREDFIVWARNHGNKTGRRFEKLWSGWHEFLEMVTETAEPSS